MALSVRPDYAGLVFGTPEGDPTHPDRFPARSSTAIRLGRSCRGSVCTTSAPHTQRSAELKAGVLGKVVSEHLGHSSPAFTMKVYQDVLPGMRADAATAFGDAVFGDRHEP